MARTEGRGREVRWGHAHQIRRWLLDLDRIRRVARATAGTRSVVGSTTSMASSCRWCRDRKNFRSRQRNEEREKSSGRPVGVRGRWAVGVDRRFDGEVVTGGRHRPAKRRRRAGRAGATPHRVGTVGATSDALATPGAMGVGAGRAGGYWRRGRRLSARQLLAPAMDRRVCVLCGVWCARSEEHTSDSSHAD